MRNITAFMLPQISDDTGNVKVQYKYWLASELCTMAIALEEQTIIIRHGSKTLQQSA
jgi:hypothetical protein